jgi:polyferredoxin
VPQDIVKQLPLSEGVLVIILLCVLLAASFLLGRAFCGKVCPFGFLQDLSYKIPFPKKIKLFKGEKALRYLKYPVLILVAVLMALGKDPTGDITFTPNIVMVVLPIVALFFFVVMRRPLCKYICPIGALMSIGNRMPAFQNKTDKMKCNKCGLCVKSCKMDIVPYEAQTSLECIRCGHCKKVCPRNAIK